MSIGQLLAIAIALGVLVLYTGLALADHWNWHRRKVKAAQAKDQPGQDPAGHNTTE